MNILILGINHQLQSPRIWYSSTSGALERFVQAQKDNYRALLRDRIALRFVHFVAEETKHGEESTTEAVCKEEKCRYANIEMPIEVRKAHGIPDNYENDAVLSREAKESFHEQREEYMINATISNSKDAASVMVVCGNSHAPRLANQFQALGHSIEVEDIRAQSWYVGDWMSHMRTL